MSGLLRSALGITADETLHPIVVIPAHNEADSLPFVVGELLQCWPGLDVMVVDDGSTDETRSVARTLEARYLNLFQRIGVGGAMRAGIRYATILGYDVVVRVDGDGQHRPEKIKPLLDPIVRGEADAVLGSRYIDAVGERRWTGRRLGQRVLAACMTRLTGQRITDPTSGLWAFGPAAVRLLAEHHPTGYPEPELLLFLRRNGLRIAEVPTEMRPRLAGESSLTLMRSSIAGVRVLLAMLIVPLREVVKVPR
jgi:glycosyltransferase involved in cell wall biosynthesis